MNTNANPVHIAIGYGPGPRIGWYFVLDHSTHSVSGFPTEAAARAAAEDRIRQMKAKAVVK